MPELSRFFGIVVRMFFEPGGQHHLPHFHAYYGDQTAAFTFQPVELVGGEFPLRQRRFVEAWAEIHQNELTDAWKTLQAGGIPSTIQPLN